MYYLKTSKNLKNTKAVSFVTLPVKRKQYTLQKAPMAHKTNSKEHYKFKFFHYKILFTASIKVNTQLLSLNSGLFFTLLIKPFFPVFGTNLLLLTSYKFPGDKIPIIKGSALNAVEGKDEATGKWVDYFLLCSKTNSTMQSCKTGAKFDHMYKITWDRFVNIKLYKYNKNKNEWLKIDG